MWRLVGVAWHGQACAGTVDNTVSSGEITEATDDVHCRAAYFRFTVGKIPICIDANGRSGACDAAAYWHPFQRRIGGGGSQTNEVCGEAGGGEGTAACQVR